MKKLLIIILSLLTATSLFAQTTPDTRWSAEFYVDEFGDPTTKGYIAYSPRIHGTFSNSATTDSDLKVSFMINNGGGVSAKTGISIALDLYEYAGNHKLQGDSEFSVLIKYNKGTRLKLKAKQYTSRIYFDTKNSKKINAILLKHNTITFLLVEQPKYGSASKYIFKVNAIGYTKVHNKFFERTSQR